MSGNIEYRHGKEHHGSSKRFTPSQWTARLMPVLLAILLFGLVATMAVVILSVLGITPGF